MKAQHAIGGVAALFLGLAMSMAIVEFFNGLDTLDPSFWVGLVCAIIGIVLAHYWKHMREKAQANEWDDRLREKYK